MITIIMKICVYVVILFRIYDVKYCEGTHLLSYSWGDCRDTDADGDTAFYVETVCTLITMTAGMVQGWTSPTLPKLLAPDSHIPITADDGSWIASIMILVSIVSVLPAAYASDRFGRKRTLLSASVPYAVGWIMIICASTKEELYISRAISGLGHGIVYTVSPMYLGEIASDKIRGSLACMITLMNKAGILSQYSIGPYVSFHVLAGINLAIPLLFAATFFWQPDSPHYFIKRGDGTKAEKNLQTLLMKEDVKQEMNNIEQLITKQTMNLGKWTDLIYNRGNRNALFVILVVFGTQQFCGSAAVTAYAQQIFMEAGGSIDSSESSIILGVVQLTVSFSVFFLVDKVGRKPLLLMSSLGVTVMNVIIGTYFYFKTTEPDSVANIGWLPTVAILVFVVCYNVGLASVPFAIVSEMFPANVKFHASSTIQMSLALLTFTVTKLYQVIADAYGTHVIFWSFACFSVAGFAYILWKLPETKGKSFSEIQDSINGVKRDFPSDSE